MFKCLNNKGFGMVEIILAVALAAMFFLGIYEIILFSNKIISLDLRKTEAVHFAQEGMEAVRLIRDNGWSANIAPLANDTAYYLVLLADDWVVTTTTQPFINGVFDRTITLKAVERDLNGDIISVGGTVDTKTRHVSANVSWTEKGLNQNIELQTYITNLLNN